MIKARTCDHCGQPFEPYRVPNGTLTRRRTCSLECQQAHRRGEFRNKLLTHRTCEVCGVEFPIRRWSCGPGRTKPAKTRTCSLECKQQLLGSRRWSPSELDALAELVGDIPRLKLPAAYRAVALLKGWPKRSDGAIWCQAQKLGSTVPVGDWLNTGTAARLIGIGTATIDKWVAQGYIKPTRLAYQGSGKYVYRREQFRTLAEERPHLFGGLDRDALFAMFEDWAFVDDLLTRYPRRPNTPRPVVRVATGEVYPSVIAAARAVFVSKGALNHAIRKGTPCVGSLWRYAA